MTRCGTLKEVTPQLCPKLSPFLTFLVQMRLSSLSEHPPPPLQAHHRKDHCGTTAQPLPPPAPLPPTISSELPLVEEMIFSLKRTRSLLRSMQATISSRRPPRPLLKPPTTQATISFPRRHQPQRLPLPAEEWTSSVLSPLRQPKFRPRPLHPNPLQLHWTSWAFTASPPLSLRRCRDSSGT